MRFSGGVYQLMHFAPFRFACEQLQREQSLSAPIRFRKQGFLQIELKEGYLNTEVGYFSVLLKVGLLEDDTVGKDL